MNKIYKLVYSKTLNQLVAVSELATQAAAGKEATEEVKLNHVEDSGSVNLNKLALTFVLSSLATALPLAVSTQQAKAETPSSSGPVATATQNNDIGALPAGFQGGIQVDQSFHTGGNGPSVKYVGSAGAKVPVINIAAANDAGVSDNRFTSFKTNTGAKFNNIANSNGKIVKSVSVLGEKIEQNNNLKAAAKTILAQVTGGDKAVIQGTLEVLGEKADLLVINPNGIDLNGVNLVNTKEFTAATADVVNPNQAGWENLTVSKGEINVNKSSVVDSNVGLTGDDVDTIRLIAKAVKIKAAITTANKNKKPNIVVAGGKQKYNLKTDTQTRLNNEAAAANERVAISGSALGAMYGNKVNFLVSESGAGVEYEGKILAEEDIVITADGKVKVDVVSAKGNVNITSRADSVEFYNQDTSKVVAKKKVTVKASNSVGTRAVGAVLASDEAVEVSSANESIYANKVDSKGSVVLNSSRGNLVINGLQADGDVTATAKQQAYFWGKTLVKGNFDLTLNPDAGTNAIARVGGAFAVAGTAHFTAPKVEFKKGIGHTEDVEVAVNKLVVDGLDLSASKTTATKTAFGYDTAKTFKVGELTLKGTYLGDGKVSADAFKFKNVMNSDHTVNQDLANKFQIGKLTLDLTGPDGLGVIGSKEAFKFALQGAEKVNAAMNVVKANSIYVHADDILDVKSNLILDAQTSLTNEGIIESAGTLGLYAGERVLNEGVVLAHGDAIVKSNDRIDQNGYLKVKGNLTMQANEIHQTSGVTQVGRDLTVRANKYELKSELEGDIRARRTSKWSNAAHSDAHAARVDRYWLILNEATLDTSDVKVNTATTEALGNVSVTKLDNRGNGQDRLVIHNSRFWAGGDVNINGTVKVLADTFKVSVADLFKYGTANTSKNGKTFSEGDDQKAYGASVFLNFQPWSLIGTSLWGKDALQFNSFYDFLDAVASDDLTRRQSLYQMRSKEFLELAKQANYGELYEKALSAALGANWKSYDHATFKAKWEDFKRNQNNVTANFWAPDAELSALGTIRQTNGSVVIGENNFRNISQLGHADLRDHANVEVLAQKINTTQKFADYVNEFGNLITKTGDRTFRLNEKGQRIFEGYTFDANRYVRDDQTGIKVDIDDKVAAALVLEQYKDAVGGYLSVGVDQGELLKEIAKGSDFVADLIKHKRHKDGKYEFTLGDREVIKVSTSNWEKELHDQLKLRRPELKYVVQERQDINGTTFYVPKLHVGTGLTDATNRLNVAANASSTNFFSDASEFRVNRGSVNAATLSVNAAGDIEVVSATGQVGIAADTGRFITNNDFRLDGNAFLGNTVIEAQNVEFSGIEYFNHAGSKVVEAQIEAEDLSIKAKEKATFTGVNVESQGDVLVDAKAGVEFKTATEESSVAVQVGGGDKTNFRQVTVGQEREVGSSISAKNITVVTDGELAMRGSTLAAEENLDVTAASLKNEAAVTKVVTTVDQLYTQFGSAATANMGKYAAGFAHGHTDETVITGHDAKQAETYASANGRADADGRNLNAGVSFVYKHQKEQSEATVHSKNLLDGQNLNLNIAGDAQLNDTDVNTLASKTGEAKTANFNIGGSLTAENSEDVRTTKSQETGFSMGTTFGLGSGLGDLVNTISDVNDSKIDGKRIPAERAAVAIGSQLVNAALGSLASAGIDAGVQVHKIYSNGEQASTVLSNFGGNVNINTNGDFKATGLQLGDGTGAVKVNTNGGDFELTGGTNRATVQTESTSFGTKIGVSAGVSALGGAGSVGAQLTYGQKQAGSLTISHENTGVTATDFALDTTGADGVRGDASFTDASIRADQHASLNVGNLDLTTNQDVHTAKTKGFDLSGGIGGGGFGFFGPSGALQYEQHHEDSTSISELTAVEAGKSLQIDTTGDLNMTGAVINAGESGTVHVGGDINSVELKNESSTAGYTFSGSLGAQPGYNGLAGGSIVADDRIHINTTITTTIASNIQKHVEGEINGRLGDNVDHVVEVTRKEVVAGFSGGFQRVNQSSYDVYNQGREAVKYVTAAEKIKSSEGYKQELQRRAFEDAVKANGWEVPNEYYSYKDVAKANQSFAASAAEISSILKGDLQGFSTKVGQVNARAANNNVSSLAASNYTGGYANNGFTETVVSNLSTSQANQLLAGQEVKGPDVSELRHGTTTLVNEYGASDLSSNAGALSDNLFNNGKLSSTSVTYLDNTRSRPKILSMTRGGLVNRNKVAPVGGTSTAEFLGSGSNDNPFGNWGDLDSSATNPIDNTSTTPVYGAFDKDLATSTLAGNNGSGFSTDLSSNAGTGADTGTSGVGGGVGGGAGVGGLGDAPATSPSVTGLGDDVAFTPVANRFDNNANGGTARDLGSLGTDNAVTAPTLGRTEAPSLNSGSTLTTAPVASNNDSGFTAPSTNLNFDSDAASTVDFDGRAEGGDASFGANNGTVGATGVVSGAVTSTSAGAAGTNGLVNAGASSAATSGSTAVAADVAASASSTGAGASAAAGSTLASADAAGANGVTLDAYTANGAAAGVGASSTSAGVAGDVATAGTTDSAQDGASSGAGTTGGYNAGAAATATGTAAEGDESASTSAVGAEELSSGVADQEFNQETGEAQGDQQVEAGAQATNEGDAQANQDTSVGQNDESARVEVDSTASDQAATPVSSPADGNAKVGEQIPVSDNSFVVKHQVGNLSCYVLNNAPKDKASAPGAGRPKARTTLFTTFSKGIESTVGEGGVVCIPNDSQVLQTEFNLVEATEDLQIVKYSQETAAQTKRKPKALDAVVVSNRKVVRVRVSADKDTTAVKKTRAVSAPQAVSVVEIDKIKQTLRAKGIDASKLMILGTKGAATESVSQVIRATQARPTSASSLSDKLAKQGSAATVGDKKYN